MRFVRALIDRQHRDARFAAHLAGADGDVPKREKHLYSAAKVNRVYVVTGLGVLGALIAAAVVLLIPSVNPQISAWGGVAAATLLSSAIFWLYEKRVWRTRIAACLPGTTVPDMRGTWKGELVVRVGLEDEEGVDKPLNCDVRIAQDWSRLMIDLCTSETESWSVMATVDANRLHYEYYVVPKSTQPGAVLGPLEPHYGMARLTLSGGSLLSGEWFNDQHFQRWGEIRLDRVSTKPARWSRRGV
jgi:SMODS-associating 2TM, beta-strand rich effector domain